ncbi:alpha/beta fold hydrolase [Pseudoflavonifractor sp.]|uniref:alpha/beta fold hydrolase n=1 Tax=Pseudoflavonifractor sp. TaxID=1980281 RepID=UPI003D8B467A
MKRTSKFLSLLLALAMVCSLFVPAMAEEDTVTPYEIPDVDGKVVILHTNDTHGADLAVEGESIGMAGVAQLKKDFEAAGAKVLLLSAGDSIMGKPLVSADEGKSAIEFMNAAGYDAMTVGNHELDFGIDNLKTLAEDAEFDILCADMTDETTNSTVFAANKIYDLDGVKVGVFGLATPETRTKADASKMPNIAFPEKEELYACAQAQVDELEAAGADLIVCLGHLGIADESTGNRSIDVCENVTGIDLFIDGHSHSTTGDITAATGTDSNVVNGTKIVSTGTALANVGVVVYGKEASTLEDSLVSAASYTKTDATVAKLVSDRNAAVEKEYGQKIAGTEIDLNGSRSGGAATATNTKVEITFPDGVGVRTGETNLGDFAADAILWQARKTLGEENVDAALTNGGGIRETIGKGDISKLDLLAVFPFGNTVATIDVTGAQLLEALEAATCTTPDAIGAFPQVSGIEFTINVAVPYENGEQYPNSTYYAPANPGSRVTITSVNGQPFDAEATYTIATNDFTAKGGDTYGVFAAAGGWKDVGVALEDALINYTTEELDGKITAEQYGEVAGRISIVNLPADITSGAWYYEAALYVLDNGIMNGTGKGFEPNGTVTRGTVFQTLYNMAGKPEVTEAASFTDVEGKWYADAAAWAEDEGLTTGTGTGLFNGDAAITRQELAKVFADYTASQCIVPTEDVDLSTYADADKIPGWASESMETAVSLGILKGSNNQLNPAGTAVRSELAQILLNISKLTPTYTEETVSIEVAAKNGVPAHTMTAIVTVPTSATKDAKVPGVVMLHGTGSNLHEVNGAYDMAAAEMAAQGLATIRFNFQGIDEGTEELYVNYSYTSANIDAKAAADYLAGLEVVDGDKLGVMGWSQGGTNAFLAAAAYPDTFKSVVTWAGALDLTVMFEDFDAAYAEAEKNGSFTMEFDWRTSLPTGFQWFKDVKETDVLEETKTIKAPILTINGAADTVVDPASGKTVADAAQNEASANLIIENCDHTLNMFSGDYSAINQVISATADFFVNTLSGTAAADQAA